MSLRSAFLNDERGAVGATYAIAITGLIIVAGAAFDYNRLMTVDSELQTAADNAALGAVTQLDEKDGACARAGNAAVELLRNITLLANDDDAAGNVVTINGGDTISVTSDACESFDGVVFYEDEDKTNVATTDDAAKFVEVTVNERSLRYAFTSIGGLLAPDLSGVAMAGMGSAICEVPPLMICNPSSGTLLSTQVGWGVQATGHGNTRDGGTNNGGTGGTTVSTWAPGDFGFLEVGAGQNSDLLAALAFEEVLLDCAPANGTPPETGNPQSLYDAVNTRFDIFDFSQGAGTTLAPCFSGTCPSSTNVTKDLVYRAQGGGGGGGGGNAPACGLSGGNGNGNQPGFALPDVDQQFWPSPSADIASPGMATQIHNDPVVDRGGQQLDTNTSIGAMGLPRDLCHYTSFGVACGNDNNNRFGNGSWARGDYFAQNHPGGARPPNADTITRYLTYLWELSLGPFAVGSNGSLPANVNNGQRATPICTPAYGGVPDANRRVLQIAVVENCSSLQGASTAVDIGEWIEVFLVEPTIDTRGNGALRDSIYIEIIGPASLGDGSGVGNTLQSFRKDRPYLVQ